MSTPADLFDAYHSDYQQLIESVRTKLDKSAQEQQGEQRKATLRRVEIELDEADDIISQLEVEIQGIPASTRSQYTSRLKQAKLDLNRYKKLAKDSHAQVTRAYTRFDSTMSDDPYDERANERTRLLTGYQTLEDGSRRIDNSTRLALETEDLGADILRSLRVQREQIENTSHTLNQAETSIDRASGTIQKMIRQMYKQRFVIAGIILVLIVVVVLILYFKLFYHRH
ncbi:vesicle transport v-snare protein vti1 [Lentinula raphanica]|uniref:Vesicle transport v-snare protein vti1 n=1 Tax=Lentinula raphanica TaxID=153919 RepID=A0AA38PDM5_9AGAR|nr:vesicle transport v-snare protein vti1 [Lentinula raphanica]KAJ3840995.1 vesicle transport v-snare protein vti1 [Lentinula raphanica]KAJ3964475.1 vesicle transport v-snare protein vti1 [Lentinula raphanica]